MQLKVLLDKVMKKKLIMALFGTAFISAGWTYYKTDDPIAACDIIVERANVVWDDACKVVSHYLGGN